MRPLKIERRIKYESEVNPNFGKEIAAMTGGEDLYSCIQCGTCSSTCPMSIYMHFTPRRVIAMTRAGFDKEVLSNNTVWLCASCYQCSVDCPKEIRITDVMYALKRKAIERKMYPRGFAVPALAKEFYNAVHRSGRSNEIHTVTKVFLKTNPLKLIKNAVMGIRLLFKGRLQLKIEKMEGDPAEVRDLLDAVRKKRKGLEEAAANNH